MSENKKHTILIIEDEPEIRGLYARKMKESGYLVLTAADGEEGFALALEKRPDIILLDYMLPKMNGLDMLKKLREHSEWGEHVPTIMLTNISPNNEMYKDIVDTTPTYYLIKSNSSPEDIAAKIRERLAETG
jgi:DNA-binding response OmpR family regulator